MHKKPTPEELEAERLKALEKLEKEEPKPTPSEEVPSPSTEVPEPTPSKEIEKEPTPSPEPSKEIYKNKFRASTQEAQIIALNKKKMEMSIDEAQEMPAPTIEDLKAEYPEWDDLSEFEKKIASKALHQERINNKIREIRNAEKEAQSKVKERISEIDEFVTDPNVVKNFPRLQGKESEFKKFSTKPTRMTADLEDLAKLFLIDVTTTSHKGSMFPTGSGGPNDNPKPKKEILTAMEGRALMKTNYNKYKEFLKAGKIANE